MYWKDKYYELLPKYEMEKIKSELFEKELEELKVRYLSHYYNYIQPYDFSLTVKIQAEGLEGCRIQLEPSSFAQGVLIVCTIPFVNQSE